MFHDSAPLRVGLTRSVAESEHLVDAAVVGLDGVKSTFGDVERLVIPRSALKPVQVIPLVSTGAADAFGFSDEDIALSAASHSAEPMHLERTAAILERIGLDASALECGATRPLSEEQQDRVLRSGERFGRIHNCCSGKHAGFLAIAQHLGVDPSGYVQPDHPVQQLVTAAIEAFTGFDLGSQSPGVDGCGIPTHAVPLKILGFSMARLVSADGNSMTDTALVAAANRVVDALAPNPHWMSGADRAEVLFGERANEPLLAKIGAEGVFVAALPERGLGVALKARDGARRAADLAMEAILVDLGVLTGPAAGSTVTNAEGNVVGEMQVIWP